VNRRFRLTRSADFQRVREQGKSYAHPLLVLIALPDAAPGLRFGIVAGRALGNAVRRNRAKRLVRSALQPHLPAITPGWVVVLIARRPMENAGFAQTQAALLALLRRARLISEAHDD
jgi:ribonuclease P protein component